MHEYIRALILGHSLISLVAIIAGIPVMAALARGRMASGWIWLFLASAIVTSASGFLFPFHFLMPSHIVGAVALVILAGVLALHFSAHTSNLAALGYTSGMMASLYLLVFVGVAQAFAKIDRLHALAPTQSEAPFAATQLAVLIVFILLGVVVARGFIQRRPLGVTPEGRASTAP
jgi:hypothetical protein